MNANCIELLEEIEDIIGQFHRWPRFIQNYILHAERSEYRMRFAVTIFFLCNGLDPRTIHEWFAKRFRDHGPSDVRHVTDLINKYPNSNWLAYNITMDEWI